MGGIMGGGNIIGGRNPAASKQCIIPGRDHQHLHLKPTIVLLRVERLLLLLPRRKGRGLLLLLLLLSNILSSLS